MGNPSPREPQGGAIPDDLLPKIVAGLRAAAAIADEYEVTLGLENVRLLLGQHRAQRGAQSWQRSTTRGLRAIWDPGNGLRLRRRALPRRLPGRAAPTSCTCT